MDGSSPVNPSGNVGTGSPGPFRPLYGGPVFNDTVWLRNQFQTKLTQLLGDKVDVQKFLKEDAGEDKKLDGIVSKELGAAIRGMRAAIKDLGGPIDPTQPIPVPIINGARPNPATVSMSSITAPPNLTPSQIAILNPPIPPIGGNDPKTAELNAKIALKGQLVALMQGVSAEANEMGHNQHFTIGEKNEKQIQKALNHVAVDLGKATAALPAAAPRTP